MIAKAKKSIKKPLVKALGSRKRSTARVWLYKGKGDSLINDRKLEAYFPEKINRIKFEKPFILTKTGGKFFVTVKVAGGGPMGQLEASIHGLSRALATVEDRKYRPADSRTYRYRTTRRGTDRCNHRWRGDSYRL